MEDNAERKSFRAADARCFDRTILRPRFNDQGRGQHIDQLAVQRVHSDAIRVHDFGELSSFDDMECLANSESLVLVARRLRRAMLLLFGTVVRLLFQGAAERDIELLKSAARHEKRHAALERRTNERKSRGIPPCVEWAFVTAGELTVACRMNIGSAARNHEAVDAGKQRIVIEPVTKC